MTVGNKDAGSIGLAFERIGTREHHEAAAGVDQLTVQRGKAMGPKRSWTLAAILGCAVWYLAVGAGIWAGLEPFTILRRATLAAVAIAGLGWCWLRLLPR